MDKPDVKKVKKSKGPGIWPLDKKNYLIIGVGIIVIIVGYIALSTGGVEGFMPLTVAPILLLIGYCVIIPFGIFYRPKEKPVEEATTETKSTV